MSSGVNNVNPSAPAYIYPNPANDVLHIAAKQDVRAVITGIDGKMILEQAHAADMDIIFITLRAVPRGSIWRRRKQSSDSKISKRVKQNLTGK